MIQDLYLGRNPPMFTDIRVVRQSTDDDHLVCNYMPQLFNCFKNVLFLDIYSKSTIKFIR